MSGSDGVDRAPESVATLARREQLLRRAELIARTGSFVWDADSRTIEWSEGLFEILGVDRSVPASSDLFFTLVHPDDLRRLNELRPAFARGTAPDSLEFRIHRASDGAKRHFRMNVEPVRRDHGAFAGLVGTLMDVTEQAEAEEALRESEARWRSVAINPFDYVVLVDARGVFQWVNHTAPGIREEDLIGKASVFDFIAPECHPAVRAALDRTFEQGLPSYYEAYSNVLEGWFASSVGPLLRDGKTVLASVLTRDISEARHAEAELRRRERMLRDAQRIAGFGSFYFDSVSGKFEWSREMYKIFGVDPAVSPTIRFHDALIHDDDRDRVIETRERAFFVGVAEPFEYRIVRASDGALRHVLSTGETLYGTDGTPTGFLGTTLDVTAQRELEADLAQSRKLEAVGRLAGGIAHDFNNVLTAIIGNVEIVSRDAPAGSPTLASLDAIGAAARRASSLTRQLLAFARRQIISPRVIEPNPVVESIADLIRPLLGESIKLKLALEADAWRLLIDVGQFEQLLMNLAVNARDAMPDGGLLRIEVKNVVFDQTQRGPPELPFGRYVCIAVTDTGHGIPPALQAHVFEPFFTTKPVGRGTGLGLATCHGIVNQNRGHIRLESVEGRGTRMLVYLPRATEPPSVDEEPDSTAPQSGSETVLVVEDDASVRALAVRNLSELGYRVMEASTGAEALALGEAHGGPIDVLFTDVVLPDRRGSEVAERLSESHPETRVLFTSAYAEDAVVAESPVSRHARFLHKPYTAVGLGAAVRAALDEAVTLLQVGVG